MKLKTLAVALLSTATAIGLSISAAFAQVAEVSIDLLNVRSGPGTNFAVRGTIPRGAQAKIIEIQGLWLYIVTGPVEGWVYAPYVTILDQPGPGVEAPATTVMVCNGTNRTTARVYRQSGELKLRVHDRLDNLTWLDTPARIETSSGATAYININGEQTTRVLQSQGSPTNCSIQTSNRPLETGVVTEIEQPQ
ncbi:SH3 domain-containing protein [Nodosilinea sp. LEGE 07298]|uniref:SH3 domain-containing protein n=1 Tax=Nodosilinea sp. LEGE 07298 TaxID=2777970 RepID=UPI00187E3D4C|nr:SH3 domain-containing protein [Nodosilinea sp. LEGE 07298]MBE9114177.1 SH3 domain-containing protein [Nodosilinea sp. LEGE 07298]